MNLSNVVLEPRIVAISLITILVGALEANTFVLRSNVSH